MQASQSSNSPPHLISTLSTTSSNCLHFADFDQPLRHNNVSLSSSWTTFPLGSPQEAFTSVLAFRPFIVVSNSGLTISLDTESSDHSKTFALVDIVRQFNLRQGPQAVYRVWADGLSGLSGEAEQARYGKLGALYRRAAGHIILLRRLSSLVGPTSPSTNATESDASYFDDWHAPLHILSHGRPQSTFVWVPRSTPHGPPLDEPSEVGAPGRVASGDEEGSLVEIMAYLECEFSLSYA